MMINAEDPKTQVKNMIRQDPDTFEKCVLTVMIGDIRRAQLYSSVLGKMSDASEVADFNNPTHLAIYYTLLQYYGYHCSNGTLPAAQPQFSMPLFERAMNDIATLGQYLPLSLMVQTRQYLEQEIGPLFTSHLPMCNTLVDAGMTFWLGERRKSILISKASTEMWESSLLADNIRREMRSSAV